MMRGTKGSSVVLFGLLAAAAAASAEIEVVSADLMAPAKVSLTPRDQVLVTEAGAAPNSGRISLVDQRGGRRSLISGLPSGLFAGGALPLPNGPTGIAMGEARVLYVLIGAGDTTSRNADGTESPNPRGPASPILSSVLKLSFSAQVDRIQGGFALDSDDHFVIGFGHRVKRTNELGEWVEVSLVADLRDIAPDPFTGVRTSNPYGLDLQGESLFLADAAQNSLVRVPASGGIPKTLLIHRRIPNPTGFGPPAMEAVPSSLRFTERGVLVTMFSGFPFAAGSSEVRRVGLRSGEESVLIDGLTTAIDVLPLRRGRSLEYVVLEFSSDFLSQAPGRVLRFSTPSATPEVLAEGLVTPSAMAYSTRSKRLFVTEFSRGRLLALVLD